jgi:hypothetical protein
MKASCVRFITRESIAWNLAHRQSLPRRNHDPPSHQLQARAAMPTVSGSGHVLSVTSGQTSSGIIILQQGEVDVYSGGTTVATSATFAQEYLYAARPRTPRCSTSSAPIRSAASRRPTTAVAAPCSPIHRSHRWAKARRSCQSRVPDSAGRRSTRQTIAAALRPPRPAARFSRPGPPARKVCRA